MPSGVEHFGDAFADSFVAGQLIAASMPSGVEHTTNTQGTTWVISDRRLDAFGR